MSAAERPGPQQLIELGNAREDAGDLAGALELYRQAVALAPSSGRAHLNLGIALAASGEAQAAMASYDEGLAAEPSNAFLHYNRALLKYNLADKAGATADARNAVRLKPDFAAAHILLSNLLDDAGDTQGALGSIDAALAIQPDTAGAHLNRGRLLLKALEPAQALQAAEAGMRLAPDDPELHWLVAMASLLAGDFVRGWTEYEWRASVEGGQPWPQLNMPGWDGRPARGKTVLVFAEQGFGDSIQFLRYLPLVAERVGGVILQLPEALIELARESLGAGYTIIGESQRAAADMQCPMLSLPHVLGAQAHGIPQAVPYLRADPHKVSAWRERLAQPANTPRAGPRVGLVCSGRPTHLNDGNRSIPLDLFRTHMPQACEFVLLQPTLRNSDSQSLGAWTRLRTFTRELTDFTETAALVEALDLVVTVDTSVAHLAGALGKPVWVLLPHYPDWRWMLDRTDSPWYPTARLYRQERAHDWVPVLERVARDLSSFSA